MFFTWKHVILLNTWKNEFDFLNVQGTVQSKTEQALSEWDKVPVCHTGVPVFNSGTLNPDSSQGQPWEAAATAQVVESLSPIQDTWIASPLFILGLAVGRRWESEPANARSLCFCFPSNNFLRATNLYLQSESIFYYDKLACKRVTSLMLK